LNFSLSISFAISKQKKVNLNSIKILESKILANPEDLELRNSFRNMIVEFLAESYKNDLFDSLLEICKKAIYYFPADETVKELVTGIYFKEAKKLLKQGDLSPSLEYLESCKRVSSNPEIFEAPIIDVLIRKANKFYEAMKFRETKNTLEEVLARDKNNYYALYKLGEILLRENNLRQALDYWKKIPQNKVSYLLREKINLLEKDIEFQNGYKNIKWNDFNFYTPVSITEISYALRRKVDEVYREIGKDFNYYPDYEISIILYPVEKFNIISDKLYPTAGLYDGRIRLPSGDLDRLYHVLKHEYTHLIVNDLTLNRVPVWFNEGLAEYEAGVASWRKKKLRKKYLEEGIIDINTLEHIFLESDDIDRLHIAYIQSYAFIDYIIRRFGFYTILKILSDFKNGDKQEEIFRYRLSSSIVELTSEVEKFVKEKY